MLSPYRSKGITPVEKDSRASDWRHQRLGELGLAPDSLRMALRTWDSGLMEGVVHQEGQFTALQDGCAGNAVPAPPEELGRALALDLELLNKLRGLCKHVTFDYYGTEAGYPIAPIILEPRLEASQQQQQQGSAEGAPLTGGWWALEAALRTPLTWPEIAASLGISRELAAKMPPTQQWDSKEEFWSHMLDNVVSFMDGGAKRSEIDDDPDGPASPTAFQLEPAPGRDAGKGAGGRTSNDSDPAGHAPAGKSSSSQAPSEQPQPPPTQPQRQQEGQPREAVAMAAALRELCGALAFPKVLEVTVGSDALGWNPIPLLWLGRSRTSGAILGLVTTVVWT